MNLLANSPLTRVPISATDALKTLLQYPHLPKSDLAKMAGYKCSANRSYCNIFAQVMVKLDSARYHKELFREIGWGEVQIAFRLMELGLQNANLTAALNATVQSARCMEMQKADLLGEEGFSLTVTRAAREEGHYN